MGKSFWFECGKCGYRTKVAGRADQGLNLSVQTIACQDCKELFDAVVQIRMPDGSKPILHGKLAGATDDSEEGPVPPPSFGWASNRLSFLGEKLSDWLKFPLQCPVSPIHRVRAWNDPDKCPRCSVYMEKNIWAYRVWE